jgi:hypothetical protein
MREAVGILVLAVVLGGCVRADPPSSFKCTSSSDCPVDERCSNGACLTPGECLDARNCTNGQICKDSRCIEPECDVNDKNACNGYRCVGGICATTCGYGELCQDDFDCDFPSHQCKPRPRFTGETCNTSQECLSGACCGPPAGKVCGVCLGLGSFCSTVGDCQSGYCCPNPTFGKACASSPCP